MKSVEIQNACPEKYGGPRPNKFPSSDIEFWGSLRSFTIKPTDVETKIYFPVTWLVAEMNNRPWTSTLLVKRFLVKIYVYVGKSILVIYNDSLRLKFWVEWSTRNPFPVLHLHFITMNDILFLVTRYIQVTTTYFLHNFTSVVSDYLFFVHHQGKTANERTKEKFLDKTTLQRDWRTEKTRSIRLKLHNEVSDTIFINLKVHLKVSLRKRDPCRIIL